MSKIKSITVSNLKAVANMQASFEGCTAIITGGNNRGKSTFLKALPDRIRGIKPANVLRHGENNGYAELELTSGERFQWSFDGKKEKLVFITPENQPQSITKGLSQFYFPSVFDIDRFLNSEPAKQKAMLEKLTGIEFGELNHLIENAREERLHANRKAKEERAKVEFFDWTLSRELEDVEPIRNRIAGVEAHNLKNKMVNDGIVQKKRQAEDNQKAIEEFEAEIAKLLGRIADLKSANVKLGNDVQRGTDWLNDNKNKAIGDNEFQALKQELETVQFRNKKIDANNRAWEQELIAQKAEKNAKDADDEVKKLEVEKMDVIKNANIPDGFTFTDNGILYNGYELDKSQLSSSAIYIAALKLAALTLGDVKTLHFDASYLDRNSLKEIEDWAKGNNLQLLIERPDFEGGEIEYQIIHELQASPAMAQLN